MAMLERQKVIKGLTECVAAGLEKACPADCPYFLKCFPDVGLATPFMSLMADALSMLKEQEPVAPKIEQDIDGFYATCGNCKTRLWKMFGVEFEINPDAMPQFCPHCGRKVKWDD